MSSFHGITLAPGAYWVNLENAVVNDGDPAFWDQNSGRSLASNDEKGAIPSESFTVLGSAGTGTGATTPESGSIILFGSGILSVAAVLRRKLY